MSPCVCVFKILRKSVLNTTEKCKSHEGRVCESTHTLHYTTLVSLVSSILVLVWYQSCKLINHCGTSSSTTNEVVR